MCLSCYQGFCTGPRNHTRLHFEKTGHSLYLRLLRRKVQTCSSPASKITKIANGAEGGMCESSDDCETDMEVVCVSCDQRFAADGYVGVVDVLYEVSKSRRANPSSRIGRDRERAVQVGRWESEAVSSLCCLPSARSLSFCRRGYGMHTD